MWQVIHVLLVTYDDSYHSVVPNGVWHFRAKISKTFYENNVITETDMAFTPCDDTQLGFEFVDVC